MIGSLAAALSIASAPGIQGGSVTLYAGTARLSAGVEVRLRWRIAEGWIPPGGFKLYRITGGSRQLVKAIPAPTDSAYDAVLEPKLKGRKLIAAAAQALPAGNRINFNIVRPPSRAPEFTKIKGALEGLRQLSGPVLPPPQMTQRARFMSEIRGSLSAPPGGVGTAPARATPAAFSAPAGRLGLDAKTARIELQLASALNAQHAELLSLGATDKGVANGATVTYVLHGVGANGQEIQAPLATLPGFVVGADAQPALPAGVVFYQNENQIAFRWQRPTLEWEQKCLLASYRISRQDAPNQQPRLLTQKPLLLVNLPGNKESISYFSDTVDKPGSYVYRITMIDGFGRISPPAGVQVVVADWRLPRRPSRAGASLGKSYVASVQGTSTGKRILARPQRSIVRMEPTVAWLPGALVENLPVKFHIYRTDLDLKTPTPVRITQAPVDGTVLMGATAADMDASVAMVLGTNYEDVHEANLAAIMAREATTPDQIRDRARDAAIAQAKFTAAVNRLKASIQQGRVRAFVDATAKRDNKYAYLVSAVHPTSGLESDVAQAGQLDFPDLAKPPAVAGLQMKNFTLAPARTLVFSKPPTQAARKPFAASAIKQRKTTAKPKIGGPTAKQPLFQQQKPIPLALLPTDYGGTVELSWSAVPGKDVKYQIFRRPSAPFERRVPTGRPPLQRTPPPPEFLEVGLTAPNVTSFRDNVPRTRSRFYDYKLVAISRWGVMGTAAVLSRVRVPTMFAPDVPNLLSAGPGDSDGTIKITVAASPDSQDVHQYVLFRDGQQVQTRLASAVNGETFDFVDPGRTPGTVHSYAIAAETAAPVLKSPRSRAIKASAIKTTLAKPANLVATSTPQGVRLTWTAVQGQTYIVRRRTSVAGPATVLAPKVAVGTFTDVFAMAGKAYIYEVAAVDPSGVVSPYESQPITVPIGAP